MYYYQLYAVPSDDIVAIKDRISELLEAELILRPSDVWGDYYMTPLENKERTAEDRGPQIVSVYPNEDWEDGLPHRPDFASFPLLVSIYDSEDQPRQKELLENDPEIAAVEVRSYSNPDRDKQSSFCGHPTYGEITT